MLKRRRSCSQRSVISSSDNSVILQRTLHLLKSSYSTSIVPHSSALYSTPSAHTSIKIKICLKESFGVKCNVDLKADKWAV